MRSSPRSRPWYASRERRRQAGSLPRRLFEPRAATNFGFGRRGTDAERRRSVFGSPSRVRPPSSYLSPFRRPVDRSAGGGRAGCVSGRCRRLRCVTRFWRSVSWFWSLPRQYCCQGVSRSTKWSRFAANCRRFPHFQRRHHPCADRMLSTPALRRISPTWAEFDLWNVPTVNGHESNFRAKSSSAQQHATETARGETCLLPNEFSTTSKPSRFVRFASIWLAAESSTFGTLK